MYALCYDLQPTAVENGATDVELAPVWLGDNIVMEIPWSYLHITESGVGLRVNCPLFLSVLAKNGLCQQIWVELCNIRLHKILLDGSRVVYDSLTDRHSKTNAHFCSFVANVHETVFNCVLT